MKVSCLQENLARGLNIVSRAVAPRTATLPVLTHVLIATDNGRLRISATNLELGVSCWIGARVDEEGAATVPARTFQDLVNLLTPGPIDLEATRTQSLRVRSGKTENTIKGMDHNEFPLIPAFDPNGAVQVDPKALKQMITQVAFAASSDESRPAMTGVLTKLEGTTITMAATDGFRLSVRTGKLLSDVGEPRTILAPRNAVTDIQRILSDQDEPVSISLAPSHGQVLFHLKDIDVVAQLIDQKFPNYEFIIPKKHDTRVVVNTAEFIKACRVAGVFARESSDTVRLSFVPADNRLVVAARSDETGENVVELDAAEGGVQITGQPLEIGFNVKFLIEVLGVVDKPQTVIEASTPRSAAVIRPLGDDDFLHVLMPINIPRP
jgi:DNA polymerase-3 subunit beta